MKWLISSLLLSGFALIGCDSTETQPVNIPIPILTEGSQPPLAYAPLVLEWEPVVDATSYEVSLIRYFEGEESMLLTVVPQLKLDTVLAVGEYAWRVRALFGQERGEWSDTTYFVLDRFQTRRTVSFHWSAEDVVPNQWYGADWPQGIMPLLTLQLEPFSLDLTTVRAVRADSVRLALLEPEDHLLAEYDGFRVALLTGEDREDEVVLSELMPTPEATGAVMQVNTDILNLGVIQDRPGIRMLVYAPIP